MKVPKWFSKELYAVDPTYRVEEPEDHNGFFIIKDVDLTLKVDDGKSLVIPGKNIKSLRARGPIPVLWIPDFGTVWIDKLREMKRKALELGIYDDPTNELAYYQKLKRESKKKKEELSVDMITEGLMEGHRLARKKSWSYGGDSQKKETS